MRVTIILIILFNFTFSFSQTKGKYYNSDMTESLEILDSNKAILTGVFIHNNEDYILKGTFKRKWKKMILELPFPLPYKPVYQITERDIAIDSVVKFRLKIEDIHQESKLKYLVTLNDNNGVIRKTLVLDSTYSIRQETMSDISRINIFVSESLIASIPIRPSVQSREITVLLNSDLINKRTYVFRLKAVTPKKFLIKEESDQREYQEFFWERTPRGIN